MRSHRFCTWRRIAHLLDRSIRKVLAQQNVNTQNETYHPPLNLTILFTSDTSSSVVALVRFILQKRNSVRVCRKFAWIQKKQHNNSITFSIAYQQKVQTPKRKSRLCSSFFRSKRVPSLKERAFSVGRQKLQITCCSPLCIDKYAR